jgi:hypothetical protein
MSMMSVDVTTVRPRGVLRWVSIIGGVAIAIAIGMLGAESVLSSTIGTRADLHATLSPTDAAPGPATLDIVPSPVIETNAKFFFGTGDGSAGYYSERPVL